MSSIRSKFGPSGLIQEVLIGVSEPLRKVLRLKGIDPPPRLRLPFLIDTGADTTLVNDQHMRTLAIAAKGTRRILTATTDATSAECSTYDIELQLSTYGDAPLIIPALEALGRPFHSHSFDGLIGRDVLDRVVLFVDGPRQTFRIEY